MKTLFPFVLSVLGLAATRQSTAFSTSSSVLTPGFSARRTVALHAISALAKKAKEDELRKYIKEGIDDSVREKYAILKQMLDTNQETKRVGSSPGPLQQALTKRKGTVTVIAEFKRKNDAIQTGHISDIYDPETLSPAFREYGASAVAVMADERMGGCTYQDMAYFVEEQRRAKNMVPGPLSVINNDLIIDELQVARSAAMGVAACVITLNVVGEDKLKTLLEASQAVGVEAVVAVSTREEAQKAVKLGARIVLVMCSDDAKLKAQLIEDLEVPDGQQICTVANIGTRKNQQLQEIEDAWALRDKGFNAVWVGDALYKAGNDSCEHPGAVIKAMRSKSSLKWASPKARSGKGEGAREYLGDIMM